MFEEEYKRANDRIHPRKDLLKEMEKKWADEQAAPAEEERGRIVAFPAWAKYLSVAAGILLCVGVGMGSVLLYARGKGMAPMSADAAAPQMMAESAVVTEEVKIVTGSALETTETETAVDAAVPRSTAMPGLMLAAAAPVEGMHPAADEAEVSDAVRPEKRDRGEGDMEPEANAEAPQTFKTETKAAAKTETVRYPAGTTMLRDDLLAVFLPTAQQVRVIQYADRKVTNVFPLNLKEKDAQVQKVFWEGAEIMAAREKNGATELLRFDVADWKSPRHLMNLTQSGAFLQAEEMGGRIFVLSLFEAAGEELLPRVNGAPMAVSDVLLDGDRPGSVFTVITVYEPGADGFVAETALLTEARGALVDDGRLLVWAGAEETVLYVLTWEEGALTLTAEDARPGTVLDAGPAGEGYSILLQSGEEATLLTLDADLNEEASVTAQVPGELRFAAVYEGGAMVLTDGALHWITGAGDAAVEMTGDAFTWLSPDRGLVLSKERRMYLVDIEGNEPVVRGTLKVRDSLDLLIEDPSRMAFDMETQAVVFPAGQKVYQYRINAAGEFGQWGTPLSFGDHSETDQRELRVRLMDDRLLVFYKAGVIVCNLNMQRQLTGKY